MQQDTDGLHVTRRTVLEAGTAAAAAVIDAIPNATGARIRDFPATPDKLLAALEALDG